MTAREVDGQFRHISNELIILRQELGKLPGGRMEELVNHARDAVQEAWDFWAFHCSGLLQVEFSKR